jgi:hypothetical protein
MERMNKSLLAKPWVRIVAFLWGIVFPIVFVGLPLVKVATGEAEFSMQPIWALALWLVSPLAVSIVLKYARGENE